MPPRDYLEARIDGEASDYFEWLDAGRVDILSYGGAMNIANPLVKTLFFGFDRDHIFLRIDTKKNARTYFENGFSLRLHPAERRRRAGRARSASTAGSRRSKDFPAGARGAVGRHHRMQDPASRPGRSSEGGEFQLQMHWSFNGQPFQTIPAREPLTIKVPGAKDYAAYWQV